MVTKAIILGKVVGTNKYNVRVPYFESSGEYPSIFEATLSTQPSLSEEYKEGDVVFVTFEDKQIEKIVIIGSLSTLGNEESRGYAHLQDLKVEGSANLPLETSIGGYSLKDLPQFVENINIPSSSKFLPNYTLKLSYVSGYGTQANKFLSIDYSNYTSESAAYFKLSSACCHGNGVSYQFLEDILIGCTKDGVVTCKLFKYNQQPCSYDGNRNYGDVFYVIDNENKIVDFYILCGQYSHSYYTPFIKIGNTTTNGITQYTGTPTKYSSGTKVWADGNSVIMAVQDHYETGGEQEIGTWVDGKKIYRQAFRYTGNLAANTEVEVGDIGVPIGDVLDIKQTSTYKPSSGSTDTRNNSSYDMYYGISGSHSIIGCRVDLTNGKVYVQSCNDSWINTVLIVIVEYTKSS